jgi:hypothetical protein
VHVTVGRRGLLDAAPVVAGAVAAALVLGLSAPLLARFLRTRAA